MTARIYRPARTAMQSGVAKTSRWLLEYEPEAPRSICSPGLWSMRGSNCAKPG